MDRAARIARVLNALGNRGYRTACWTDGSRKTAICGDELTSEKSRRLLNALNGGYTTACWTDGSRKTVIYGDELTSEKSRRLSKGWQKLLDGASLGIVISDDGGLAATLMKVLAFSGELPDGVVLQECHASSLTAETAELLAEETGGTDPVAFIAFSLDDAFPASGAFAGMFSVEKIADRPVVGGSEWLLDWKAPVSEQFESFVASTLWENSILTVASWFWDCVGGASPARDIGMNRFASICDKLSLGFIGHPWEEYASCSRINFSCTKLAFDPGLSISDISYSGEWNREASERLAKVRKESADFEQKMDTVVRIWQDLIGETGNWRRNKHFLISVSADRNRERYVDLGVLEPVMRAVANGVPLEDIDYMNARRTGR